jgi:hypothetical protein
VFYNVGKKKNVDRLYYNIMYNIRKNDLMKINNEKGLTHFIFMKFSYTVTVNEYFSKRIVYNLNNTEQFIKI